MQTKQRLYTVPVLMISLPKLMGSCFAAGLVRLGGLSSELLLGLVVAVGDQSVQEAVRAASVVALGLCALDLTVEVAGGLLVDVVLVGVLAEISCVGCQYCETMQREACAGQEMAGLPFLSCMESLRFSFSLMLDMFVDVCVCVVLLTRCDVFLVLV
jgi:hypothetical protein